MHPANRRRTRHAASTRRSRARWRGFTLVEMLVSVTLVLMMMLMFAEIYSLAQQTMSTQRGIAENDQKARILTEVLHRDLDTRTFRSVYPFKLEPELDLGTNLTTYPPPAIPEVGDDKRTQLLALRKGYFSISENDPDDPTDDVLQLTVQVDVHGGPGERVYGKAPFWNETPAGAAISPPLPSLPMPAAPPATREENQNHPEYDDGVLGNAAGMSGVAEVSYFLRGGNLFRSVLLVRDPYPGGPIPLQPTIDPLWGGASPFTDYRQFSRQYPTTNYPTAGSNAPRSFWADFDYSAYRWLSGGAFELRFHGVDSLENSAASDPAVAYFPVGGFGLLVPQSLGVPHLRFGHEYSLLGRPLEHAGGTFFGRYTLPERSSENFLFPGTDWAPFDGTNVSPTNYTGTIRRGVDLMLSNVHAFDIEVWDDVVGDFVDLGHSRTGTNPYTGATGEPGFYHQSRRRLPIPKGTLTPEENYFFDHPAVTEDFGNRYDTWNPRMFVWDGSGPPGQRWRNGRAPYRPLRTNPDPNTAEFNQPPPSGTLFPNDGSMASVTRESRVAFGDESLDDNGNGLTILDTNGDGFPDDPEDSDAEAPLRAVRIIVRYLDAHSGQMRQSTIEASLID